MADHRKTFAEEITETKDVAEMIVSMQNAGKLKPIDFTSEEDMQYLYTELEKALESDSDHLLKTNKKHLSHTGIA